MPTLEKVVKHKKALSDNGRGNGDIPDGLEDNVTALTFYTTCRHEIPTAEEERELFEKYFEAKANGSEEFAKGYREKIVKNYERFVLSIAREYTSTRVPIADIFQDGNVGLLKAIDRFNPKLGYRFPTYAGWWVRQSIIRSLPYQVKIVRLPVHMSTVSNKVRKIIKSYKAEHGEEPSIEEIVKATGYKYRAVMSALMWMREPVSLDTPIGEDGSATLGELVEDTNIKPHIEYAQRGQLQDEMAEALEGLTKRERRVIEMRFGIPYDNPMTLEEVGDVIGVTRERVRQIQAQALRKLRHPTYGRKLKKYLG